MAQVRMVVDTANLIWRVAAAGQKYNGQGGSGSTEEQAGLALHMALMSLRKQYERYRPDQVALTFEGGENWRKAYTRGELTKTVPVSPRIYKANRVKDDSMKPFFELIAAFEDLVRKHSSIVCLGHPELEGDDLFSGYAQYFTAAGDTVIGVSDDKDFCTLLQLPNFQLVRPDGSTRELGKDKMPDDAKYFMYEKAFRGDAGDNVLPAFPRVRATKLKAAYDGLINGNGYEHSNLMNSTWVFTDPGTGVSKTMRVGDLYEENRILMDLIEGQPQNIKDRITQVIEYGIQNTGKFKMFEFQRFCGKYELNRISEEISKFIPLFSSTGISAAKQAAKTRLIF